MHLNTEGVGEEGKVTLSGGFGLQPRVREVETVSF